MPMKLSDCAGSLRVNALNKSQARRKDAWCSGATSLSMFYWIACSFLAPLSHTQAQVNVLTYHNDNARTGQNLNETLLAPSNVNTKPSANLFPLFVDGRFKAQPLTLPI